MSTPLRATALSRPACDPAEWATRVDLAACYRLLAHFRLTDLIYTHISARVPGSASQFLINPYGLLFDEIKASNLMKIDLEGNVIDDPTGLGVSPGGFTIHAALHGARHDVDCIIHTHTAAGLAVSAQRHGLLPITQHAMRFTGRTAYHDYEGLALDLDEQKRLIADMGRNDVMILRNHGLLVCGPTVHDAFDLLMHLERACEAQVRALAGNAELVIPSQAVAERVAAQFSRPGRKAPANAWAALRRMLDRTDASYQE